MMHDPLVVAFDIRRPWPRRERSHDSIRPHRPDHEFPRWRFKLHHDCLTCSDEEHAEHAGKRFFPWWRPSSWTPFWTVAGKGFYWPSMITVWHREPGGHDSGEVCKHYRRKQTTDGTYRTEILRGWRLHVWHWRIQVHPLQALRRWALTRCEWCRGRSIKGDPVNVSHQWDRERGRWWRGERGLFHHDCSSIASAHHTCVCNNPVHEHELSGWTYGRCARCGKHRAWKTTPGQLERTRLLAAIPAGQRDAAMYARVCELATAERETRESSE